jgi:hypothetical protein
MVIDQRNAGASFTPSVLYSSYTLDRWNAVYSTASKFSVQQNAGSITPPVGFKNYLGVTSLSAYTVGASEQYTINQYIEGLNTYDLAWGTANAKAVTLSFQVYSSLTGTFGGFLQNGANNYTYPFTYSIPVANTWTTISVTIAGPTSGTWATTNAVGIQVAFSLGAGASVSGAAGAWAAVNYVGATGATSVVGTNGATFYITGVQLEVGSSATGFEYRQYGTELALCQRYYFVKAQGAASQEVVITAGGAYNANQVEGVVSFPVTMRTTPSAVNPTVSGGYQITNGAGTQTFSSYNGVYGASPNQTLLFVGSLTLTSGFYYRMSISNGATTAYLAYQAEL